MSSYSQFPKLMALVSAASAAALSSCTLPPNQAWRKIKDDGLIAYWSYEMGSQHAGQKTAGGPPHATPAPQVAQSSASPINQPGMLDVGKPLTAQSIASLPGFVRSPYTNPPRLVDVKGAAPGSTMICPYTQRAFIVPADFVSSGPATMVAESQTQGSKQANPSTASSSSAANKSENLPKVVINNRPTDTTTTAPASSQPKSSPAPASTPVANSTTPAAGSTAAPAPKPVQEIPFGNAIAGRPGFVNSPFAAKHQLVDVTGLPTGMEVKCPYTGKLFRVPPQDVASSKPAETAPLASPEEPKKK